MLSSCLCRMRGRGLWIIPGPAPTGQQAEAELEPDEGSVLAPKPAAVSSVVWASPAFLFRLVLSLALLVFPCPAVAARVSSSLSTTHHVHHFHNKHGTVPIAINRMPFLTRGGHGKNACSHYFLHRKESTNKLFKLAWSMGVNFHQGLYLWWQQTPS